MKYRNHTLYLAALLIFAACSSDKPTYLEPHLSTLAATDITRTTATLHGTAIVEGDTDMPQLNFSYGTSASLGQSSDALHVEQGKVALNLQGLKAGTTYYYMLQGTNGRTITTSNTMTFTTLPNVPPTVGNLSILSHGPMSLIVNFDISDDGGEQMTEAGCYLSLASAPEENTKVTIDGFDGKTGTRKLRIGNLQRNATYQIKPFAQSVVGETVGDAISYSTSDAILLAEAGELSALMGSNLYEYTQLSIAGTLNGNDLSCLRRMMGRDDDNVATLGKLSDIDMTDVHLADGGVVGPYHHQAVENHVVTGLFAGCDLLTHISLPADANTIEQDAFAGCTALEELEIPASVVSLTPSKGCTALKSIKVSNANANYRSQDGVLLNADASQIVWFPMGKKGDYNLPNTITGIGNYAFKECHITKFHFPDNLKEIGQGAFMGSWVEEVKLPATLQMIPTGTFQDCKHLKTVYLGAGTNLIANYAFDQCPLTDLYVDAIIPPTCQEHAFSFRSGTSFVTTCTLHVPAGLKAKYQNHQQWKAFMHIVEN